MKPPSKAEIDASAQLLARLAMPLFVQRLHNIATVTEGAPEVETKRKVARECVKVAGLLVSAATKLLEDFYA